MIGNLRRPIATNEAVVDISFDRLAQSSCAACGIHFPAGGEHQCATRGNVGALVSRAILHGYDVIGLPGNVLFDAASLFV